MSPFLRGFGQELMKLAAPAPGRDGIVRPPSTAPQGQSTPTPSRSEYIRPTSAFVNAIPRQQMTSPAKSVDSSGWKPSPPGPKLDALKPQAPKTVASTPSGGAGKGGLPKPGKVSPSERLPFETDSSFQQRRGKEIGYDAERVGAKPGIDRGMMHSNTVNAISRTLSPPKPQSSATTEGGQ
jgi:hypothetical protein